MVRLVASESRWSDQAVEQVMGRVLQAGVLLAAAVVLAGGVVYLRMYGAAQPNNATFIGEPDELTHIGGIVRLAAELHGRGLIQLGLIILIATPIMRVAFSLIAFLIQRDRTYVLFTAFVLLLLLASLGGHSL